MELSHKIRNVILTIIKDKVIAMSWGITNININKHKLSFNVNGYKFVGRIEIIATLDYDKYQIQIGDKIHLCKLNQLVSLIDKEVEYAENYKF